MYLILKKTYISHRTGSIYSIHWIERSYPFVNVRLHVCVDIACFLICFACEMTCVLIHDGGGRKFFFLWLCCYCSASAPEKKNRRKRPQTSNMPQWVFVLRFCVCKSPRYDRRRKKKQIMLTANKPHIRKQKTHIR